MQKPHVVLHPSHGYVNKDHEYAGYNLQEAERFSDEDLLVFLNYRCYYHF